MRQRIEVDLQPAFHPDALELHVRVMSGGRTGGRVYSFIDTQSTDFIRSHFDIVWEKIGELLKRGIAEDVWPPENALGTYRIGGTGAAAVEVPPAKGDVAPDSV
jgi:hypothetical protein